MKDNDDKQQSSGVSASTIAAANQLPDYMPPWMKNIQPMQLPQGGPGQLQMLAQDLARGGYGTGGNFQDKVKSNFNWMDMFYNPVNTFKQGDLTKTTDDKKPTGTPGERPTPYMVPTNTPMGGNSMTEWWKTSLAQDPTYRKVYGDSRKPKG